MNIKELDAGTIITVTGYLFLIFAVIRTLMNFSDLYYYKTVTGEVSRIEQERSHARFSHGKVQVYYVKYTVDGKEYESHIAAPYDGAGVGSEVTVHYKPSDPSAVLFNPSAVDFVGKYCFVLSAIIILCGRIIRKKDELSFFDKEL